ncbi:MAG: alpha-mannosidase [Fimbriimonadaceae bacterium]
MLVAALLLITAQPNDRCLGFVANNLAKGNGNFYEYVTFSEAHVTVKKGDVFVYDVWLDPANPAPKGGIDIDLTGTVSLRDHHLRDQNGIPAHGDGLLIPAVGAWYTRRFPLDDVAFSTTQAFNQTFEGDEYGRYAQFIDHVAIRHADGTASVIYPTAEAPLAKLVDHEGYSDHFALGVVPRADVTAGRVDQTIAMIVARASRYHAVADAGAALSLAVALAKIEHDSAVDSAVTRAKAHLKEAADSLDAPDAVFNAKLQSAKADLAGTSKFVKSFTADAVGHAHIDVQWLWESQESLQAAHDTWRQALKFMDEYPDFKFTQSSAGYYREFAYTWPDLFAQIKKRVKEGRWEIVGGRECEADENLISPEAHARQFLYAQRYFKDTFGKTAVVGWEPDTFGHTAQMPQILKLGGCKYFYFCRGGKGAPLFHWQGLDGSTVLAFDSQSSGNWYNMSLDNSALNGIPGYVAKTGVKDIMWVYGVGNHGGGPTKEHIETAKAWEKEPGLPTVKFSTAENFFHRIGAGDTSRLPTVTGEMEGVFRGCYTTNSMEKRLNRRAEAEMVTAEATASVANYLGHFPYPRDQFAKNWEKIAFNQHHDTMCGSSFHWAYLQTIPDLNAVIATAKDTERDALDNLSVQVKPMPGGENFLVFNPTGWPRSGWAQLRTPGKSVDGRQGEALANPVAVGPDGIEHPIRVEDPVTHAATFFATDVPAFGYRVYVVKEGKAHFAAAAASANSRVLENSRLRVVFDTARGCIKSLVDKRTGKEYAGAAGLGVLESHLEKPVIEAWDLGDIVGVQPFRADASRAINRPGFAAVQFTYRVPGHPRTPVVQTFRLDADSDKVDVDFNVNWRVVSNERDPSPLIRLAFTGVTKHPIATYQVPFGAVARPTDGEEGPAQAWADISGPNGGITVVEDCKHGFSATGSTLRMSVIRGNVSPDMLPNRGPQPMRYEIVPHEGDWQAANGARRAMELENGLESIVNTSDADGASPLAFSFASVLDSNVVPTCLKKAEDGDAFVIRMYESTGRPAAGKLQLTPGVKNAAWVNFLENTLGAATLVGTTCPLPMRPWQISTLRFRTARRL